MGNLYVLPDSHAQSGASASSKVIMRRIGSLSSTLWIGRPTVYGEYATTLPGGDSQDEEIWVRDGHCLAVYTQND